jgi:GNAT superfamily N-acetyltransferase
MKDDIRIRKAKLEDASSLAILSNQLGYPTSASEIIKRLLEIQRMKDEELFVAASLDKNILGWVHVLISYRLVVDPFAELGGLVVTDGYRGQGIGKLLLTKAEEWARERGLDIFRIRARSTREGAHHFYSKMGYQLWKDQKVFEKQL